jgi:signal transduction histidine kinase
MFRWVKRPLVRLLILRLFAFSAILTTMATVVHGRLLYSEESKREQTEVDQLLGHEKATFERLVWEIHTEGIQQRASTLFNNPNVIALRITDSNGQSLFEKKKTTERFDLHDISTAMYAPESENETIGYISYTISRDAKYLNTLYGVLKFFFLQLLKSALVSIGALLILYQMLVRHFDTIIEHVAKQTQVPQKTWAPLQLARSHKKVDELEMFVNWLNQTGESLNRYHSEQQNKLIGTQNELAEQKALAMRSAHLANLGELSATIAHEIRNPLAIISGYCGLLEDLVTEEAQSKQDGLEYIKQINKAVKHTDSVIKSVLNSSRSETDSRFDSVDLRNFVEGIIAVAHMKAKSKGVRLSSEFKLDWETKITIRCTAFSQVLTNLLNNSFDAIEEKSDRWVKVSVSESQQHFVFTVTDSGNGIPIDVAKRMFEAFYTTKPANKGTGIGLDLVKRIVTQHEGHIWVDHSKQNTTICFSISKNLTNSAAA